ncbi:MAG: hypothetical protein ACTIM4_14260 [Marinomonas sp.]
MKILGVVAGRLRYSHPIDEKKEHKLYALSKNNLVRGNLLALGVKAVITG